MAANHLDSKLLDFDAHNYGLRLSVMRIPYRTGHPFLPIPVHREQLERGDHRCSLCLGCTSSLPPCTPLV